ncbi:hypothetical protein RIF29_33042 [Crotalaria pallida]|uniref:Fe2OG dioxygenase domain-containing protein n=1 Tax=Crotalaria pallida TaxID=3830 RepID=A0AAN9HWJ8_CROPI
MLQRLSKAIVTHASKIGTHSNLKLLNDVRAVTRRSYATVTAAPILEDKGITKVNLDKMFWSKPCSLALPLDSPLRVEDPNYEGIKRFMLKLMLFYMFNLEKTFKTTFSLLVLHMWLCLRRLKQDGKESVEFGNIFSDDGTSTPDAAALHSVQVMARYARLQASCLCLTDKEAILFGNFMFTSLKQANSSEKGTILCLSYVNHCNALVHITIDSLAEQFIKCKTRAFIKSRALVSLYFPSSIAFPASLMASTTAEVNQESNKRMSFTSVKSIAESPELTSTPSSYIFTTKPDHETVENPDDDDDVDIDDPIPIIDYSLLVNGTPDQRAKVIHDLGKACEHWGFFMLINHTVPKSLMEKMVDQFFAFFNLKEEEKQGYSGKEVTDPIRYGTSFNASMDKVLFWRDFVKILVQPEFHSPDKPVGFRDASADYSRRTWKVGRELLKGISESLGLEANYIDRTMNLDSGLQMLAANLYPPCPQPELVMGMPPHSDHGLLNLLVQDGVSGLQVLHNSKWINVSSTPNCLLVLVSDHLEVLSNGKYKSVLHRVVVSNKPTRMSLAIVIAPSLDTVVEPAPELIDNHTNPPAYFGMKHQDFMELQRSNQFYGKSVLNKVKI